MKDLEKLAFNDPLNRAELNDGEAELIGMVDHAETPADIAALKRQLDERRLRKFARAAAASAIDEREKEIG